MTRIPDIISVISLSLLSVRVAVTSLGYKHIGHVQYNMYLPYSGEQVTHKSLEEY